MSFGVSVGDFIAAGILIKNIVSALQSTSTSNHQELLFELHALQRALHEIEHLHPDPQQETEVNAVKVAALTCQYRLDDFARKLHKYESLGYSPRASNAEKAKSWRLKLQWGFSMEAEVQSFRAYLIAHVGYLNLRLTTLNLTSSWHASRQMVRQQNTLDKHIVDSQETTLNVSNQLASQTHLIQENNSWAQRLTKMLGGSLLSQVTTLVDLVGKIWAMDKQIIDLLMRQQNTNAAPDLHHTWFQQPVKFEDALGRILPVPSEYNLGKINAIILDQFKVGPGRDSVSWGQYQLFNSSDARTPLSDSELDMLIPGMSITMAFVIGKYLRQSLNRCPRPGCQTQNFSTVATGGRRCVACNVWFDISNTKLPRPFRFPPGEHAFKQLRAERKWFKNVRIIPSEMPSLPIRIDHAGYLVKHVRPESVQPAKNELSEYTLAHSSPYRAPETLPAYPMTKVSQETAAKVVRAIREVIDIPAHELREITGRHGKASIVESLGLDSLLIFNLILDLKKLEIDVPGSNTGSYLEPLQIESFLESCISKHFESVDGVGP